MDAIIRLANGHGFNAFTNISKTSVFIQIPDNKGNIKNFRASSYSDALFILGY